MVERTANGEIMEVELKFQVLDISQVREFLKGLKFINRERVVDVYLDTKDADLYKKGIFIRVRNQKSLDFKYNLIDIDNKHEECEEISFSLPLQRDSVKLINSLCNSLGLKEISQPDLEEFKIKNNLISSVVIDKVRQEFTDGKFRIFFDVVKGLGKFIEIEAFASEDTLLENIKNEMRERIKDLNLKLITTGYNELYWRKHNFNIYLQGRYLLKEDTEKDNIAKNVRPCQQ